MKKPHFWNQIWNNKQFEKQLSYLKSVKPENRALFKTANKLKKGSKVVEIGCGSSMETLYACKKFNLKPYLLDISPNSQELSKDNSKRFGINSVVKFGDIRKIPLPDNFADITWSGGVNEHLVGKDRTKAIDEMLRITKPNGSVIIATPYAFSPIYRFGTFIRSKLANWNLLEIPYSEKEIKQILSLLQKNRYRFDYRIYHSLFLGSLGWIMIGRYFEKLIVKLNGIQFPLLDRFGYLQTVVIHKWDG